MPSLKLYHSGTLARALAPRKGEVKLGEKLEYVATTEALTESKAEFVIVGIPEDIGVRANYGIPGTSEACKAFLKAFLNIQHNQFMNPKRILILGEVDCTEEMKKASYLETSDPNYFVKLGELVEKIDEEVSATVALIISAGKVPIIIGGGHNNAFGNIQGAATAFGSPINVLNIDAHTDLRHLEHRHSGNGFSYALHKNYLRKYAVFGLQQNYTPQFVYDKMNASADLRFDHLEDILEVGQLEEKYHEALEFVNTAKFGLEIDCDAIAGFPSSASSPSGLSLDQVRKLLRIAAREQNCSYLHLCEASVREDYPTGKALSLVVSDFIKATSHGK